MRGGANPQIKQVLDWMKTQINSNSGIAEEWHDGANFYVKFKNGLIVQGGAVSMNATRGYNSIISLQAEYSEGYAVFVAPRGSDNNTGQLPIASTGVSVFTDARTRFNMRFLGHGDSDRMSGFFWLAVGY